MNEDSSVFHTLQQRLQGTLQPLKLSKATLIHLTHILEDVVLKHELPAFVFTGFQEASHWSEEIERYQQLATIAKQVVVFADDDLPPELNPTELHIPLENGDSLSDEWLLVIMTNTFSVVLSGLDTYKSVTKDTLREFDTLWSFASNDVERVLDVLEMKIEQYRPDSIDIIKRARAQFHTIEVDPLILTEISMELMHFQEQLRATIDNQNERIEHMIGSISHVIYMRERDVQGNVKNIFVSPSIQALLGYAPERFIKDPNFSYKLIHPDDIEKLKLQFEDTEKLGKRTYDFRMRHMDDHWKWIRLRLNLHQDHDDHEKTVFYGVMEDITNKKEAEQRLLETENLAFALEKQREMGDFKNRMMYTISHEFRTPLSTILTSSESLERYRDRMTAEQQDKHLRKIQEQVLHLRQFLEDINTVLEAESDEMRFRPMPLHLRVYCEDIVKKMKTNFDHGNHQFVFNYNGTENEIYIEPDLIKQIINNLLSNAIKYSAPETEVRFDCTATEDTLTFVIQDHGIGIPEKDREHVFTSFHRGSNVDAIGGTGFGLKIVKDCVTLLGGNIDFTTELDIGTTFTVTIPHFKPD